MYINDIIKGLLYIHNTGVIHRDLKPANIFISDEHLILGDFGLAVSANSTNQFYGTPNYVAPELWADRNPIKRYTQSTDLFAAGCIFYELCTLQMAFPDIDRNLVSHNIQTGNFKPIMTNYSNKIKNLIYALINPNPSYRQNTQDINRFIDSNEENLLNPQYQQQPIMQQQQQLSQLPVPVSSATPTPISYTTPVTALTPVLYPQVQNNAVTNAPNTTTTTGNKFIQSFQMMNNSSPYSHTSGYQNSPSVPYQQMQYKTQPAVVYPSTSQFQQPSQQQYSQQYPSAYPVQQQIPPPPPPPSPPPTQQPVLQPVQQLNQPLQTNKDVIINCKIRMNNPRNLFILTDIL